MGNAEATTCDIGDTTRLTLRDSVCFWQDDVREVGVYVDSLSRIRKVIVQWRGQAATTTRLDSVVADVRHRFGTSALNCSLPAKAQVSQWRVEEWSVTVARFYVPDTFLTYSVASQGELRDSCPAVGDPW